MHSSSWQSPSFLMSVLCNPTQESLVCCLNFSQSYFYVFRWCFLTMSTFSISKYHNLLSIFSTSQVSCPPREMDQKAQLKVVSGMWLNNGLWAHPCTHVQTCSSRKTSKSHGKTSTPSSPTTLRRIGRINRSMWTFVSQDYTRLHAAFPCSFAHMWSTRLSYTLILR